MSVHDYAEIFGLGQLRRFPNAYSDQFASDEFYKDREGDVARLQATKSQHQPTLLL